MQTLVRGRTVVLSMSSYEPQTHLREAALVPESAALLVIDVQNFCSHRDGEGHRNAPEYYWQTLYTVVASLYTWVSLSLLARMRPLSRVCKRQI